MMVRTRFDASMQVLEPDRQMQLLRLRLDAASEEGRSLAEWGQKQTIIVIRGRRESRFQWTHLGSAVVRPTVTLHTRLSVLPCPVGKFSADPTAWALSGARAWSASGAKVLLVPPGHLGHAVRSHNRRYCTA